MNVNPGRSLAAAKPVLTRNALLAMHTSRMHRLAPASLAGVGAIFMLHRVREDDGRAFAPNKLLEVTPSFLEATINRVRELGLVCVSLDEAIRRMNAKDFSQRFAVFTLDDGYKDNLTVAAPIFERMGVPFTVYLASGLPDGTAELWWVALERIIAKAQRLRVRFPSGQEKFDTSTLGGKLACWNRVYWRLRSLGEDALRTEVRRLAAEQRIDIAAITSELAMSWDEVRALAANPMASIEAHTADHFSLARIPEARALGEIAHGVKRMEAELGRRPLHFSYPYGDAASAGPREFALARQFGFQSATTTRKGLVQAEHAGHLMQLPRLSLNGNYQDVRVVEVLLSGLPFALARGLSSGVA
ncbi:MAG TPA: polysaccharide deacetylase family protein [Parvibaculum sp.]